MRGYSSKQIIKILTKDGWYPYGKAIGSHHAFKHPFKEGKIIVPHPKKRFTYWYGKKYRKASKNKIKLNRVY